MGKTVAICQFGGELVQNKDGSMLYTGGEAHAIQVMPEMKFDEFKSEIAEMCHRDAGVLVIKYFLPSNKRTPIMISNDKDMQRMISFHEDSATIDVFVLEGQTAAQKAAKTANNGRSKAVSKITNKSTKTASADSSTPISTVTNDGSTSTQVQFSTTTGSCTAERMIVPMNNPTTVVTTSIQAQVSTAPSNDSMGTNTAVPATVPISIPINGPAEGTMVPESITPLAVASGDKFPNRTGLRKILPRPMFPATAPVFPYGGPVIPVAAPTPIAASFPAPLNSKGPDLPISIDSLEVGQEFNSVSDFREALRRHCITKGFRCVYVKNEKRRVTAKCKADGCPWRVHASRLSTLQKFKLKKINNIHTCGCGLNKDGHCRVSRSWVASIIKEKVRDRPLLKPKEIVDDIYREYGVNLKYHQARRGKETALAQLEDSRAESYGWLPWFCGRIRETNPGSIATVTTTGEKRFHRLFVSFHASRVGFENGCRPLILLDGTSLREKCAGTLLAAVSVDGDDGIFPLAFAIVDAESYSNWHWFLTELKSAVPMDPTITFVSDRRNGLDNAVPLVFGDSYHAYSLQHLMEDFKQVLKGPSQMVKDAMFEEFKRAAYTGAINQFNASIESIRNVSHEVAAWVLESKPEHWSNAFFRGARYDHVSSNIAGMFYNWIPEKNELSIIQIIDIIRCKMMELIYARREASRLWSSVLTPSMEQRLQLEIYNSRPLSVLFSSGSVFEVRDDSGYLVDIDAWECTCRRWKMSGLPCVHAAAVFDRTGRNMYDYCSKYFTVDYYRLAYAESINPIPDIAKAASKDSEEETTVLAPRIHRPRPPPRWPRKKRKEPLDGVRKRKMFRCSTCGGSGHNKATCGLTE